MKAMDSVIGSLLDHCKENRIDESLFIKLMEKANQAVDVLNKKPEEKHPAAKI